MPLCEVLAKHRVNLLGGASDAGKTSFILPAMAAWGPRWVYVCADRSDVDALEKIEQLGLTHIPLLPAFGRDFKSWPQIVEVLKSWDPLPEYVVFEGFQRRASDHNKANYVFEFLNEVDSYLKPTRQFPLGLTMLGIAESPKQTPKNRYSDPRQRISGCSAWGSHASTILLLETMDHDREGLAPDRQLWVCMKNKPRRKLIGSFDERGNLLFPNL